MINHKCLNCGKYFDKPSTRKRTCSATCRKQYQRKSETLSKSYSVIMSELMRIRSLIKTHSHLRPQIAETLGELKDEINFVGRMAGHAEMIAINAMLETRKR